ncbi:hypothetical protein HPC49_18145 [Pyxidicoccus fallax]|uniref:Uncharacterized protein n=1 Tax=Pyxidicoccus fallax TaxID=394095 RepID=A0A848LP89_9BACT|nr:hypothetical protein [Pyxidicoccus fallax]NMO19688.1 hypothetical protein [Pyxidicoccus fallax]NPC80133.1 hypothetical protein [Pyxidicoccus fallax]
MNSPEYDRLGDLWEQRRRDDLDRWFAFLDDLERVLPDFTIGDATPGSTSGAFRCVAYANSARKPPPFRFVLVGCVSILAPIYAIYAVQYDFVGTERHNPKLSFEPLPPEMRASADLIARKLEATFDVRRLPREVADTPVPLIVQNKEPPETTLFHAFFGSQPENIP